MEDMVLSDSRTDNRANEPFTFRVAKKIRRAPANSPGFSLRRFEGFAGDGKNEASVLILGEDRDIIRRRAAEYSLENSVELEVRARGKSMEICCAMGGDSPNSILVVMDFVSRLPLAGEDFPDLVGFFKEHSDISSGEVDMGIRKLCGSGGRISDAVSDGDIFGMDIELPDLGGLPPEAVYEAVSPVLYDFDMGIIKGEAEP